jgi:hypothetical protein
LCWNLRFVKRVLISWRILVFFKGIFFLKIMWWNIWVSIILLFCLKILLLNVNGKATQCDTPACLLTYLWTDLTLRPSLHEGPGPICKRNRAILLVKNLKLGPSDFTWGSRLKSLKWHVILHGTLYGIKKLGSIS